MLVNHHILEHGAETLRRGVDFGFGFGREADHLGIAAAFEVEHAVFGPAMLVVADERAVRIRGQRRLAGAGQAEEDCAFLGLADIDRAVHRHDLLWRQKVVEDREDGLLHFARVGRATDQDDLLFEGDRDHRARRRAMDGGISLEAREIDDRELRVEGQKFAGFRLDEKVLNEQ